MLPKNPCNNNELATKATIEYVDDEVANALTSANLHSDIGFASVQSMLSVEIDNRVHNIADLQNQINLLPDKVYVDGQDQYILNAANAYTNIKFNTIDLNLYYTKLEVDYLLLLKADITYVDSQDLHFFNQASTSINAEQQARIAGDNALGVRIDGVETNLNNNYYTNSDIDSLLLLKADITFVNSGFENISSLLTIERQARIQGDTDTLNASKAYTDLRLGDVDFSNFYTRNDVDALLLLNATHKNHSFVF